LVKKLNDLKIWIAQQKPTPAVVTLVETWLNKGISDKEIALPGYDIVAKKDRTDTDRGRGGGIVTYVKNELNAYEDSSEALKNFNQATSVQITTKRGNVQIVTIYRSPNSDETNNSNLCKILDESHANTCVVGDFNYPDIDWEEMTSSTTTSGKFVETVAENDLKQKVTFNTRDKNILDLVLIQDESIYQSVKDNGPLSNSDHSMITVNLNVQCDKCDKTIQMVPNYGKANFRMIRKEIAERNWEHDFKYMSVDESWEHFQNSLNHLMKAHIPMISRREKNCPVWADKMSKMAVKKKSRWWKKYRKGKVTFQEYKVWEKNSKRLVKQAKRNFEKKLVKEKSTNPRKFYAYINGKNKTNSMGPIKSTNGKLLLEDKDKVKEFNKYFASVFGEEDNTVTYIPKVFDPEKHKELNDLNITVDKVEQKIKNLKAYSAPGPDSIHPLLLKKCSNEVAVPLAIIYQKSIEEGRLPKEFKRTNISPLYKKGNKLTTANYRPINMASVPGKILESIVKDALLEHLEENNLLLKSQHGFRSKKSVTTCLLDYLDDVTKCVDDGNPWVTFIGDFAKAFDKVPFAKLLSKLENHGVKGKIYNWIKDWTIDRKQRVVLNGTESDWLDVTSSVVQGSVLGPILFLIFINDLDIKIQEVDPSIKVYKFADDSKIGKIVKNENDELVFQKAIDAMTVWCKENGMSLHPEKCSIMKFGSKGTDGTFTLMENNLKESTCERDLGVFISSDLKSTKHVQEITSKANGVLSRLKRTVTYRNRVFVDLYKVYVRPILESNSVVWNPSKEMDIKKIEGVQRRALKSIKGWAEKSYEDRLKCAGIETLKQRREKIDMIHVYKFMKIGDRKFNHVSDRHNINTRSVKNENLIQEKCRTNIRQHFFDNRVVNKWNNLPLELRNVETVKKFKNMYNDLYH